MSPFCRSVLLILLLGTGPCSEALADGLTVTLNNNSADTLQVTVWDLNTNRRLKIVDAQSINGFASIAIQVKADVNGHGRVAWSATTADSDMRHCGHRSRGNLHAGSTVNVSAGDACAAR